MSKQVVNGQVASPLQPWPARSHIAVFVRCLHLLDLDLLEDWPAMTEQLFHAKAAQQNIQQRVKAVEWSLYRLFEIYDPAETKDKLRPFFPSMTQLQSLNLRAALYRCLADLKKSGILGKDVVLRKTMLDDCKGERFEEAMAGFAMITLRKATDSSQEPSEYIFTKAHSLPIDLAYRVSLQNNLKARTGSSVQASQQLEQFELTRANLEARMEQLQQTSIKTDMSRKKELRVLLNARWIGNDTWTDILLHGAPRENLVAKEDSDKTQEVSESEQLLSRLDDSIKMHQTRLSAWKLVAKDLASNQNLTTASIEPGSSSRSKKTIASTKFSQHQKLNLSEWEAKPAVRHPTHKFNDHTLSKIDQMLDASVAKSRKIEPMGRSNLPHLVSPTPTSSLVDTSPLPRHGPAHDQRSSTGAQSYTEDLPIVDANADSHTISEYEFQPSSSISSMDVSDEDSPWVPHQQSNGTTVEEDPSTPVLDPSLLTSKVPDPPISPSSLWLSLADRTRASMSRSGHQSILPDQDSPEDVDFSRTKRSVAPDLQQPSNEQRRTTLLERTRESMSMFSNPSVPRSRNPKTGKRVSQMYPVNQFQTPGRPQRQSNPPTDSRSSTPRDQLFDADAEYDSIFKSRPKLALSPAFSPSRGFSSVDGVLEHQIDRLDLEVDDDVS